MASPPDSPPTPPLSPDVNPPAVTPSDEPLPTAPQPDVESAPNASQTLAGPEQAASPPSPAPSTPALPSSSRPPVSEARGSQGKGAGRPVPFVFSSSSSTPTIDIEKPNGNPRRPRHSSPGPQKNSLLSKLFRILIPCAFPSPATHPLDVDIDSVTATGSKEKPPSLLTEPSPLHGQTSTLTQKEDTPSSPSPVAAAVTTEEDTPVLGTPLPAPEELFVPPTPPPQLLPLEETEGFTSGAVQPPGSTGGTPVQESKLHSRDSIPPSNASTKDSDASSFTEDDDIDGLDELDIEDKLIMNGGAGIPIGPDGLPKPLLPPIAPKHAGRKCLVLDLDETLVHSSFKSLQQADYVVPVEIEYHWHNVYVIKRPGVDNFLKKMGEQYEIVVFTASLSKYADPVLDKLDIHQVVSHRLFRESCYNHKGNYVKDLSQLGRPIADTIILDNSPASYIFHPNNAVPVSSWFNDPHDTELTDLVPFLTDLSLVGDVRGVLDGAR